MRAFTNTSAHDCAGCMKIELAIAPSKSMASSIGTSEKRPSPVTSISLMSRRTACHRSNSSPIDGVGLNVAHDAPAFAPIRTPRAIVSDILSSPHGCQRSREELGDTHWATRTVMRWTGANKRTVKRWFAGTSGSSGEHLVSLVHYSDAILGAFLGIADRESVAAAGK